MDAILPVNVLPEVLPESDRELRQGHPKTVDWSGTGTVREVWSRELCEGTCKSLHTSVSGPDIGWTLILIIMTYGRLGNLFVLLRYLEQLQGASREFNAQLETASYRKMKDWRFLLLQYLLQQNRSITGEDKVATGASECKQYCGMSLLTDFDYSGSSGEGFRRCDAGPTLAGSICTCQRESAIVAFRVQAAAGPVPPISTDKEDVVGGHVSCHCPSHRSGT